MGGVARLRSVFEQALSAFLASPVMREIAAGKVGPDGYASILREVYFYTREDPQLQAFATAWFKGSDRTLVRLFLKHALSEVGHENLALADLQHFGVDVTQIPEEYPLPTTISLTSFPYWSVQFLNPVSYLGYLYFLEGLPTSAGADLMSALRAAGIPAEAMTFLQDHATIDQAHIKLMDKYVELLVRTEQDFADVAYAIHTTGKLYELMLNGAIEATQTPRVDTGRNLAESNRLVAQVAAE